MTDHLPECPLLTPCCDDEEFPEHGFCLNDFGRCLHCMSECICDALRACEERVRDRIVAGIGAWCASDPVIKCADKGDPWDYAGGVLFTRLRIERGDFDA